MNHNVKYYKASIFITLGLFLLFFFIILVSFIGIIDTSEGLEIYIIMNVLIDLPLLIVLLYYIYRYCYYKKIKLKYIQEVKLEKTYPFFNHMSGFIVSMDVNGIIKKIETKAIYSSSLFTILSLDEFIGEIVEVGYDEANDVCVIIRKISNNNVYGE